MAWIALDLRSPPIFHRDEHSTRIWTVVRAGGVDYFLHGFLIIRGEVVDWVV
jgi:hypothetical protein